MRCIPEPSAGAASAARLARAALVEAISASPASAPRVRDWDGAPKPAGVSASAGAPRNCIAWRQWFPKLTFYVAQVPGDGGKDWGYVTAPWKAAALSPYWQRRFAADCRRVGFGALAARHIRRATVSAGELARCAAVRAQARATWRGVLGSGH